MTASVIDKTVYIIVKVFISILVRYFSGNADFTSRIIPGIWNLIQIPGNDTDA